MELSPFVLGVSSIAATVSAVAISGAAGNLVGDAVSQAAAHEPIKCQSLAIDALAGAVGGAVGADSGGAAGRLAMQIANSSVQEDETVGRIGTAVSGLVGGTSGSISSGAVKDVGEGKPLFSADNALSFVTGAVGGLGGGTLTSISYLAFGRSKSLPIMATEDDFANLHIDTLEEHNSDKDYPKFKLRVFKSFVSPEEHQRDLQGYSQNGWQQNDILLLKTRSGQTYDTFAVHGGGRDVFPAMQRTVNGVAQIVLRPMKASVVAEQLRRMRVAGEFGSYGGPVKAWCCKAAWFNAKTIADAAHMDVFASYKSINGQKPDIVWHRYNAS